MDHFIYIVNCQVSSEKCVVKLGRTGNLKGRLTTFRSTFPDASYRCVYRLLKPEAISVERDAPK